MKIIAVYLFVKFRLLFTKSSYLTSKTKTRAFLFGLRWFQKIISRICSWYSAIYVFCLIWFLISVIWITWHILRPFIILLSLIKFLLLLTLSLPFCLYSCEILVSHIFYWLFFIRIHYSFHLWTFVVWIQFYRFLFDVWSSF